MSAKYFIYILVGILVIWSFDSLNINSLFKKIEYYKLEYYILC